MSTYSHLRQCKQRQKQGKSRPSNTNITKKLIRNIFEESSDDSDDEPIIHRFNKRRYNHSKSKETLKSKEQSPLNRIPKKNLLSKQSNIKRILPLKRKNNTLSNSTNSPTIQSRKKRKIDNSKRTEHSPSKRPKCKRVHNSHTTTMQKTIKKTKRINKPIVIDLLSDSDDSNDKSNIPIRNMICFAHNKCNKAVSIFNIPSNIFEHNLVFKLQKQYNINVINCHPFEIDGNNKSYKKCKKFELLNVKQRDYLLKISKQNQLKFAPEPIPVNTPPAPKPCAVYFEKDTNINIGTIPSDLHMDMNGYEWINKFPIFGLTDENNQFTPLISAQEIINVPSFPTDIDNKHNEHNEHIEQKDEYNSHSVTSVTNSLHCESIEKDGWNFYLCVEKGINNIIPMIQVEVNKTQIQLHERCDKMIWFQRKNEMTTKYCEWIENDVLDFKFSEYIDLKFIAPHMDRKGKELILFRKELNKHNIVFVNPSIFNSEYYIGIKVLAVIEHMLGGTIIKAQIMKIAIPTSINHISDTAFSTFAQSMPSTDTSTII